MDLPKILLFSEVFKEQGVTAEQAMRMGLVSMLLGGNLQSLLLVLMLMRGATARVVKSPSVSGEATIRPAQDTPPPT